MAMDFRRRLRYLRGERGITLAELLIAMSILGTVMLIFGTTLASVQGAVVREDTLSRANDSARLAVQSLDREIRSGNVLYDPSTETLPYYAVRVYTQSNAPTRAGYVCSIWQVNDQQELINRQWDPADPNGTATDWRVVATGVVNRVLGEYAFQLDTDPMKGSRTVNITIAVNTDYTHYPSQTVRIHAALTGRNTSYGYPVSVCATTPA